MNSSAKSIFVIEDSKEIRDLIKMLYESEGYEVGFASNGQEGLEKLLALDQLPGIILLDLMMPVMDGAQFRAEQIKIPRLSNIPVIVMTADSHIGAKAELMGVTGHLRKPVGVEALLELAKDYCS